MKAIDKHEIRLGDFVRIVKDGTEYIGMVRALTYNLIKIRHIPNQFNTVYKFKWKDINVYSHEEGDCNE